MDDLVKLSDFLKLLSKLTGIDDLIYEADYVSGGTHGNRAEQPLDYHVDFNRRPRGWERRLNLLLYLNPVWDGSWGGCIELQRHPRRVTPIFNRVVLFETSSRSLDTQEFRVVDSTHLFPPGQCELTLPIQMSPGQTIEIVIDANRAFSPKQLVASNDARDLDACGWLDDFARLLRPGYMCSSQPHGIVS